MDQTLWLWFFIYLSLINLNTGIISKLQGIRLDIFSLPDIFYLEDYVLSELSQYILVPYLINGCYLSLSKDFHEYISFMFLYVWVVSSSTSSPPTPEPTSISPSISPSTTTTTTTLKPTSSSNICVARNVFWCFLVSDCDGLRGEIDACKNCCHSFVFLFEMSNV